MSGFAVDVDLGNPGQLLACCGLLEAADRHWRDRAFVTGHFDGDRFCVDAPGSLNELLAWIGGARVSAIATSAKKKKKTKKPKKGRSEEAGQGDDPERAAPVTLSWPKDGYRLWLDSWSDRDFGRTTIKTFAGQQTSAEIAKWLIDAIHDIGKLNDLGTLLDHSVSRSKKDKKGFGFDQRKGRSALDIGFSVKETKIPADEFPATEILAAIGVQFCRPRQVGETLVFGVWQQPLPVELARAAAGCAFTPPGLRRFRFRLLGRKERSGVAGAPNDQYKAFTRAQEIFEREGEEIDDD
jgi:CRISPR-associated protein Csx14